MSSASVLDIIFLVTAALTISVYITISARHKQAIRHYLSVAEIKCMMPLENCTESRGFVKHSQ
jgi:hypothetical protein